MNIAQTTRTVVETGIELPHPSRPDATVFVDMDTLIQLAEQERGDSQSGNPLVLYGHVGNALVAAGLAERETRGGYHRTDALVGLLTGWGWL